MEASFVIYFHPMRLDNLMQTLRLLHEREPALRNCEVILVCQTKIDNVESPFPNTVLINLELESYQKTLMCNVGVNMAKNPIIVLLDSDRVLPVNYFHDVIQMIVPNQAITTRYMYRLCVSLNDISFLENKLNIKPACLHMADHRNPSNVFGEKNMFCGNVVMYKSDYLGMGGMDERYVGYGIADNDMTQTAMNYGLDLIFLEATEFHFWHEGNVVYHNKILARDDWQIAMAINGLRFKYKWGLKEQRWIDSLILRVSKNIARYDPEFVEQFLALKNQ